MRNSKINTTDKFCFNFTFVKFNCFIKLNSTLIFLVVLIVFSYSFRRLVEKTKIMSFSCQTKMQKRFSLLSFVYLEKH